MGSLVWSLLIGAIAGWAAGNIMRGHGFGIWVDIIVGIVGAFIGGFVENN
ncbi:MAG: Transglycosylase associated protein [Anaerospora sp.]|nr:Transglycosylase associated protein [Anaerospora sp.]